MSRSKHAEAIAACHAEGLTAPETAARVGICDAAVYNWAKRTGNRFANRKMPPPKQTPEQVERRKAAQRASVQRKRETPINGWTWPQLMDAGYTAPEAARLRGQCIEAAYKAEAVYGRKFQRHRSCPKRNPVAGLTTAERAEYHRIKKGKKTTREIALEIMGRGDLITAPAPKRRTTRQRLDELIRSDPETALLVRMQIEAERARAAKRMKRAGQNNHSENC